jgi:hypothetical protein
MREREQELKQYMQAFVRVPNWTAEDVCNATAASMELNELGWRVSYPAVGQGHFARSEAASRREAVRLG